MNRLHRYVPDANNVKLSRIAGWWAFLLLGCAGFAHAKAPHPNIVVILADDMNDGCCCGEEIAGENHCFSPSSEMN